MRAESRGRYAPQRPRGQTGTQRTPWESAMAGSWEVGRGQRRGRGESRRGNRRDIAGDEACAGEWRVGRDGGSCPGPWLRSIVSLSSVADVDLLANCLCQAPSQRKSWQHLACLTKRPYLSLPTGAHLISAPVARHLFPVLDVDVSIPPYT